MREHRVMDAVLIDGVLRRGEVMNIVAAPKMGKSWLALGLALAVAMGRPALGMPTTQGKVLLIDNELRPATLANRMKAVADAMRLDVSDYDEWVEVVSLRGKLCDWAGLSPLFEAVRRDDLSLVICDAAYRFAPKGADENGNGDVTANYNVVDVFAQMTGAAFVLVHHSSKGEQTSKSITDVGSGAGSQARACDTHMVLRPHEEPGVVVLDAVVKSFKEFSPRCLRFDWPMFTVDATLDPASLRRAGNRRVKGEAKPAKVVAKPLSVDEFVSRFVKEQPKPMGEVIAMAEVDASISAKAARKLLDAAIGRGLVVKSKVPKSSAFTVALASVNCSTPPLYPLSPPPHTPPAKNAGGDGWVEEGVTVSKEDKQTE